MKPPVDQTRRHLGELSAMSSQTERMERTILARAIKQSRDIQRKLDKAKADAMAGDDAAKENYMQMIEERGRLQQVIAQARSVLV